MSRWRYSLLVGGCLLGALAQPAFAEQAPQKPTPQPKCEHCSNGEHIDKVPLTIRKGQTAPTPAQKRKGKGSNLNPSKSN